MNILIAHKDVTTRISLCLVAEECGYTVSSAADGSEVLRILRDSDASAPLFLFLDCSLPGLDLSEISLNFRRYFADKSTHLLVSIPRCMEGNLIQHLADGADDYLIEPYSKAELRARLKVGERNLKFKEKLLSPRQAAVSDEVADYLNLFRHANDSIIVFDPTDQKVFNVNDKACETYQIPRAEFIGISLRNLTTDEQNHEEMINQVIQCKKAGEFEIIHRRSDGKLLNMLVNSSFVEYNGRAAVLSVNRDITDRREIEMVIERALQEWRDTVDAVSDMIILTDAECRIKRCNQATANFFNLDFGALIGRNLSEICGFSGASDATSSGEKTESPAAPLQDKYWKGQIASRADEWFEITNHHVPLMNSRRQGEHWVHIIKNISDRSRAEESLSLLNTAVEQAADSVIIIDRKGFIEYVNPSFVNCTGWSREEVHGRKMTALHAVGLGAEISAVESAATLPDKVWQGVYRARKKTGEKYEEEISISPVRHKRKGHILRYVAVCRDVTEKRRLESIAEAVNMMQNVGYIFSGIRHELGNPINSVKTALTVLQKNLTKWDAAQVATYIERCLSEIGRVEYLLRALKTFSMHENPRIERVAVTEFMSNFVSLVKDDLNKRGAEIKLSASGDVGEALCDPRALHQVLLNLITNASDALEGCEEPLINISLTKDKQRIYICVADNGGGMNEQQTENLFKPFYTSKENGTGLGLVIVKKMITKMNGTIHIESAPHVGSKVYFTLEAAMS